MIIGGLCSGLGMIVVGGCSGRVYEGWLDVRKWCGWRGEVGGVAGDAFGDAEVVDVASHCPIYSSWVITLRANN